MPKAGPENYVPYITLIDKMILKLTKLKKVLKKK
jgi:hypothetical protein